MSTSDANMVERIVARPRLVYALTIVTVSSLMFLWPVRHTISIRQILLVLGLLLFGSLAIGLRKSAAGVHPPFFSLSTLAILTLWILVVVLLISDDRAWSLGEVFGQWLRPMLAFCLGILAVRSICAIDGTGGRLLVLAVVAPLLLHVLWIDLVALWTYLTGGTLLARSSGLTEGPDKASYLTNMAMCFLVAEGIQRLRRKPRMLLFNNGILLVSLAATLLSHYLEGGRMASLALAAMLMVAVIIFLRSRRPKGNRMVAFVGVICGIILITAAGYNMRRDARWKTFKETLPIAWNTEDHLAWLDWNKYPMPKLSNGQIVDHSNYMHVVWFKTGVQLALENPLGVGFGRNAYGHALQKKYGEGSGHSHYGFLDLAIGIGIPGLLLWLVFLAGFFISGCVGYRREGSFAALAMILVVTDYGVRMFLDSVVRDHMLEQFLFVLAILSTLIAWDQSKGAPE